ncbi:ECF RNA polymerase sigma factor SigK [Pedobacter glucosidilyticus]|nr:sigma-70 family RNA polymerase sigma factor [Pedobacter glucosidilyticus]KHJ39288.1 ECF RNA polymerase sigma factor SigK [Pedobacter glucosidilyticus]
MKVEGRFKSVEVDNELVLWIKFKEGDKLAYAHFYKAYSALLFRYGCKISTDKELVKDAIHDLFTSIWKNKENLSVPASVKNYLVKSLRNKILREHSKTAKFIQEESLTELDFGLAPSNEDVLVLKELDTENRKKLIDALKSLSHKQKEVIFLLYYNNLSPAEVAAIMSVSIRTIYNTTFNAIQILKNQMAGTAILVIFYLP